MCEATSRPSVLLMLTAAVLLAQLNVVMGHFVRVDLSIESYTPRANTPRARHGCVGGISAGLTNTSVLLHYRLVGTGLEATSAAGWRFLTKTAVPQDNDMSTNLTLSTATQGLQFRLLQWEHGGGRCNCWRVANRWTVSSDSLNRNPVVGNHDYCFRTSRNSEFCDGSASDARGGITKAFYFIDTNGNDCPGDSSSTLISNKGSPMIQNCTMITPRM